MGELLVCKRVAGTGSLCPAGQASVRRTGVSLGELGAVWTDEAREAGRVLMKSHECHDDLLNVASLAV